MSMNSTKDQPESSKAKLPRHISSLISHFKTSKYGFSKSVNETEDIVLTINSAGIIEYANAACSKHLGYSQQELIGQPFLIVLYDQDIHIFMHYYQNMAINNQEFIMYCRFMTKTQKIELFEVCGKAFESAPALNSNGSTPRPNNTILLLAGRKYPSKSITELDSIVELQVSSISLKHELTSVLIQQGLDPAAHPLLQDERLTKDKSLPTDSSADLFSNFTFDKPGSKKRKHNSKTQLFCMQCGTLTSPEWRTGPEGPKTLCNACGLAWYKKNKAAQKQQESQS